MHVFSLFLSLSLSSRIYFVSVLNPHSLTAHRIPSLEIVKNFASEQRPETLTEMRECVSCEGACNVVIPGIVDLMVNNEELEEAAMVALAFMCRDTESRFRVREQGGIKYLVFAMSRVFVEASNPKSAS